MKTKSIITLCLLGVLAFVGCKKNNTAEVETNTPDAGPQASSYTPIQIDSAQLKTIVPGLQLYIAKEGTGQKPKNGDQVMVHYHGRLTNGQKFDSSYERGEPIGFQLGVGQVIKGWDLGIAQLNVGSKGVLIIAPELGYGETGSGPIGPNSTLVFDVELVGSSPAPAGSQR